ncbi:MAG: hypothetical protein Q7V53_03040 [Caldisericota bacterium]|nr:hypothetical protein [Caldisericota bacterium]
MTESMNNPVSTLSLSEINAQLADAAEELRDRWDLLVSRDDHSAIEEWVASNIARVRGLSDARRAHIALIERAGTVYELGERLGWSEKELDHAIESIQYDAQAFGDECIVTTHSGREIRSPAYPNPCDYIRVTQHGFELAYWTSDEWRENPEDVIGAVMGALKHQSDAPESVDLTSTIDTRRHRDRQENLL